MSESVTLAQPLGVPVSKAAGVGAQLRQLRLAAGLTQADLGQRVGTTQSAVARMEAGNQRLTLAKLATVASALGCAAELIFVERTKG